MESIEPVIRRMEEIAGELPPDDGVARFNAMYLAVTREVAAQAADGTFEDPESLALLDVVFADPYFAAVEAGSSGGTVARAWRPLFEARAKERVAPIQFALAGMNAHINHDLALGIVGVCVERGVEPTGHSPEHADYEAVNPLIADVEREVKEWLLTGALAQLDRELRPADDVVAVWSLERARDAAWTLAEVLWHLRGERPLYDEYVAVNDHAVGLASRAMLVPVGLAGRP